ncbi:Bud-site selection protein [Aulographum hederae CBS 113979]|uniref:Bud-site selection protein n=1 Tax=Aulographum hederae CBS 113979 TaxID=1176131 RepID=A0A6G1GVY1_9PEZI|nr:Bud-site selection protein [Aulographum hederae CBS 113979]
MPKRKRDGTIAAAQNFSLKTPEARRPYVEEKIKHGLKVLTRALKLARGFERQKMSRRQKAAKSGGDEKVLVRIDREIEALKSLEMQTTAEHHLYKVLLKIKSVAESPALPKTVVSPPKATTDVDALNVVARLYSASATKKAIEEVLASVKVAMGLPAGDTVPKKDRKKKTKADESEEEVGEDTGDEEGLSERQRKRRNGLNVEIEETEDDDGSLDFSHLDVRVVGSSEEDSDGEDDGARLAEKPASTTRLKYQPSSLSPSPPPFDSEDLLEDEADSNEESQSESEPSTTSPPARSKKTKPAKSAPAPPSKNSTFLPSLTMGGYWSGSESAESDIPELAPDRKNRRGQRARQKIWEKKYGKTAKHLQNGGNDANGRQDMKKGWDPKKGATMEGERRGKGGRVIGRSGGFGRREDVTGANSMPVTERKKNRDDEGKLHPSWIAAKKMKEEKALPKFTGKKIAFD